MINETYLTPKASEKLSNFHDSNLSESLLYETRTECKHNNLRMCLFKDLTVASFAHSSRMQSNLICFLVF